MNRFLLSVTVAIVATFQVCHCVGQMDANSCGESHFPLQMRVTNGWDADSTMWPWHAAIFRRGNDTHDEYICGATLIGKSFAVTAAHCIVNRATGHKLSANLFTVHLARQYLDESSEWVQEIPVKSIVMHPQFFYVGLKNDIALLSLKNQVQFNEYVQPICLDKINSKIDDLIGKDGVIVGWGKTENGHVSMTLQAAQLPVIDYIACLNSDPQFFSQLITYGMFCAGYENGTSVCNGDSGSGMFFRDGEKWILRGIVSFSGLKADRISCDFHKYAGFTNVRFYIPWIQSIVGDGATLIDVSDASEMGISPRSFTCDYAANTSSECQLSNVHIVQGSTASFHANNKEPTLVSIQRSYLQILPKSLIDAFPTMRYLNLENLRIRSLEPQAFKTAANLLSVSLQMNRLEEISRYDFSGAGSVVQLNLSSNQIEFIDEFALSSIDRLKIFDVSDNRIGNLPAFNKNNYLEIVNASRNLLTGVSDDHFVNNRHLRIVDIAHNHLAYLDLQQLDASGHLSTIDLSFNQLKRLHIPRTVKHLFANNNSIENVSAGQCVVQTLNLATNNIQSYLAISNCTLLRLLDLSNNLLDSFSYELIARMRRLETLYLSNNRILEIDPALNTKFSFLKVLDLSHNLIIYIPSQGIFRRLTTVNFSHNELQQFDFANMSRLQKAYLSGNQWDCSVLQDIRVQSTDRDPDTCGEGFRNAYGICCKDYKYPYGDMFATIIRKDFIHYLNEMNLLKGLCSIPVTNATVDRQFRAISKLLATINTAKIKHQANLDATLENQLKLSKTIETITASNQSLKGKTLAISSIIERQRILVAGTNSNAGQSDLQRLQEILESMAAAMNSSNILLDRNRQTIANLPYRKPHLQRTIQQLRHDVRTISQDLQMLKQEERHLSVHHDGLARIIQNRNNRPNRHNEAPPTHQVYSSEGGLYGEQSTVYSSQQGGVSFRPQGNGYTENNYHYEYHSTNIG